MNSILGIHESALLLHAKRMDILAGNLANADTPGFKARDFDFQAALQSAARATRDPSDVSRVRDRLEYRVPYQPSQDGNTVETDMELARFSKNVVSYQASLMFINGRISGLRTAITGII